MRYLIVSIVLLALLLGACSASSNPSPLPVVTYSTACLEDGEVPINVNPCLDRPTVQVEGESAMARPEEMPVHLYASVAGERQTTYIVYDNGYKIDLEYHAGGIGVTLGRFLLEQNACYVVKAVFAVNIWSDTIKDSSVLNNNFNANVFLYTDDGKVFYLNQQTFGRYIVNGPGDYFWDMGQILKQRTQIYPVWTDIDGQYVRVEWVVNAIYKMSRAESYVSIQKLVLLRMPEAGGTGHCNGIVPIGH